jgi:hypothetical protein
MSKHTPGPWEARDFSGDQYVIWGPEFGGGRHALIATCTGPNLEANARLIAAAPEMLAALKRAYGFLEKGSRAYEQVRAAISKAEGRS